MQVYSKPLNFHFTVPPKVSQSQYVIEAGTIIDFNQCTGNGTFQIPPGDRADACFSSDPEVNFQEGNQMQFTCQETPGVTLVVTFNDIQSSSITCPQQSEVPFNFQYTSNVPFPPYCTIISSIHLDGCWNGDDECVTVDYPNCVNR